MTTPEQSEPATDYDPVTDLPRGDAEPGVGHNQPPTPYDERAARTKEIIKNVNVWLTTCEAIESEEQAGRASDFKNVIRAAVTENNKAKTEQIGPLRAEVASVDAKFSILKDYLNKSIAALDGLLQPWLQRIEAERVAKAAEEREEAERARREADDKAAAAVTIEEQVAADDAAQEAKDKARQAASTGRSRAQVKGEVATRATGLRGQWKATKITDRSLALGMYGQHAKITELLLSLASADARGGRRRIPGFKIERVMSVGG